MPLHALSCGEIWGGVRNLDVDARTAQLTLSAWSGVAGGGSKGGDIYFVSQCGGGYVTRLALANAAGAM
ncbi:MAG: hypothetical protein RLY93_16450 [Sumerlaeia bacterium]